MFTPRFIKGFIVTFVVFMVADFAWHSWIMMDFYNARIADVNGGMLPAATFPVFIILYEVLAAACMTYFVQATAKKGDLMDGAFKGGLLGFLVSGGINFINHSLIMKWDLNITLVDTLWGIAMGAVAGAILVMIGKK